MNIMVYSNLTISQYEEVISKNKQVVLVFKTNHNRLEKLFHFIGKKYPGIVVIMVNIEINSVLADKFNVSIVPNTIFIYDGRMIHQENGLWDNGNNILSCIANMVIHHQYAEKNIGRNWNDKKPNDSTLEKENIKKKYQLAVKNLSYQLEDEYLSFLALPT